MDRILIIEDEEPISELIRLTLSTVGYTTYIAMDGKEGLNYIQNEKIALVLLDIMIPKLDGYELLPKINQKNIPVILVTAKDSLSDRVKGLNMGADDYIVKPFEGLELLARVRSVLRRSGRQINIISFNDIELLLDQRKVLKAGNEINLTPKEFDLFTVLIENKNIVMSREKLLQIVWDYDFEGNTRTVDMHIQRLREKLNTDKIRTIYKLGYRLDE